MKTSALAAILILAACTTASGLTPRQEANNWALENARATGPAQDCLLINRIRDTRVRDESTIDFYMIDGRVFRSRLPHECPGLAFDERFAYRPAIDRLCAVDIITVFHSDGMRGASCGLGPFEPIEIAER